MRGGGTGQRQMSDRIGGRSGQTALAAAPLKRCLRRQRNDGRRRHHRLLLARRSETEKPFLLAGLEGVSQKVLVVFGADEARVAVLLEQEVVDVLGGSVEREPAGMFHLVLHQVHRPAVDIDLARCSRRQEFLVDFLNVLLDARCRPSPQAVGGQPEADVLVAVLFAQVVSQLLETCPIGEQVLHRQRPTTGSFLRRNFHHRAVEDP